MPRIRSFKPSFWSNEELSEVPYEYRLLFMGLWTLSDREGRLEDRPKRIKIVIFPYDNVDINTGLDVLQDHKFIIRYKTKDGLALIQVVNFSKHQIIYGSEVYSKSIFPPPGFQGNSKEIPRTSKEIELFSKEQYSNSKEGASAPEKSYKHYSYVVCFINNECNLLDYQLFSQRKFQGNSKEIISKARNRRWVIGKEVIGKEVGGVRGGEIPPPAEQKTKKNNANDEPQNEPEPTPSSAAPPSVENSKLTPMAILPVEECLIAYFEHPCMSRSLEQHAMARYMDVATLRDWGDAFVQWLHIRGEASKQLQDFGRHFFLWLKDQDINENPKKLLENAGNSKKQQRAKQAPGARSDVQSAFSRIDQLPDRSGRSGDGSKR